MIGRANHIFDVAVSKIHEIARPGMLGKEVVQVIPGKLAIASASGIQEF